MLQEQSLRQIEVADIWRARFGEPPPILTDAETMLRVLESIPQAATPEPPPEGGADITPGAAEI